jgi:Domain of unknown function (DUF4136)
MQKPRRSLVAAACLAAAIQSLAAMDVKVDMDATFDFLKVQTWRWNPSQEGHIMLARTPDEDPDVVRARAEPVMKAALTDELTRRGLAVAPEGTKPDLMASYFMLITYGANAQYIGQFVPPNWGLPPITASTQSLTIKEQGALVLDFSTVDGDKAHVVWRGVAMAELKAGQPQEKKAEVLKRAIRDTLRKFPKTKK